MSASLAGAVANTCTAAMKVTDGLKINMPTTNAVAGEGWLISRDTSPGFLLPCAGLGLRRDRTTPMANAATPRPRRRP